MNFLNEKAETKRFSEMKSHIEFLMTDMIKFDKLISLFTCHPYITSHANDFQD